MLPESPQLQIHDIGEQGLLQIVQQYCPANIVGDDAAVVATPHDQPLIITTDLLIADVHFSDRTMTPTHVGWKAAAANLSDLAAMGAAPLGITVGLALPPETSVAWVEQVYSGLSDCLTTYQTPIWGGDLTRSPIKTIAITAFGSVVPGRVILRSQAQPGDVLITTGVHGASKAGLELLLQPELSQALSAADTAALISAHQQPSPRLDITSALWNCFPAGIRVAGMDSSDGLADAILQICRASGVGAKIERSQLPKPTCFNTWLANEQAQQWCLYGGEDYELVLTMPPEVADQLESAIATPLYRIGEITANVDVVLVDSQQRDRIQSLNFESGFQHF